MTTLNQFVTCQICSKQLKSIGRLHLRTHNISLDEYKNRFPNAETSSEEFKEKMKQKMLGREITWKDKISEGTKKGMRKEESWKKFKDYIDKRNISGENNPSFGKHHSEETKKSISENEERNKKISLNKKDWWKDNIGKTVEELFGEEIGKKIREEKSNLMKSLIESGKQNSGRKVGKYKTKFFRSVYEYYFYKYLESINVNIQSVVYEPVAIRYKVKDKSRKYYPDFLIPELNLIVEVKNTYHLNKETTRQLILLKKQAAEEYCKQHGLTYVILTEKDFPVKNYNIAYNDPNVEWIRK